MWTSSARTLFLLVTISASSAEGLPWNEEQRLVSELLVSTQYDVGTRPVKNVSEAVMVSLQVDVFAVQRLDSKDQEFVASSAFFLGWEDKRLSWKPSDFGGMASITLKADAVWYPNVLVLNAYDETKLITSDTEVVITSEGEVHVGVSLSLKTQCYLEQQAFPFDEQCCMFIIGTRSAPSDVISITSSQPNQTRGKVQTTANWEVMPAAVTCALSPSCVTQGASWDEATCRRTSQVTVHVPMRRASKFYVDTVIVPITILTLIASLVFWLPPECGEKLSFGMSAFFGVVIFQLVVQEALPEGGIGKPSILSRYVLFTFALIGASLMESAITLILHHNSNQEGDSCVTEQEVLDEAISQFSQEENEESPKTFQLKKKEPRDWKKIARNIDRFSFVLFYIVYLCFFCILLSEVVSEKPLCPREL